MGFINFISEKVEVLNTLVTTKTPKSNYINYLWMDVAVHCSTVHCKWDWMNGIGYLRVGGVEYRPPLNGAYNLLTSPVYHHFNQNHCNRNHYHYSTKM